MKFGSVKNSPFTPTVVQLLLLLPTFLGLVPLLRVRTRPADSLQMFAAGLDILQLRFIYLFSHPDIVRTEQFRLTPIAAALSFFFFFLFPFVFLVLQQHMFPIWDQ